VKITVNWSDISTGTIENDVASELKVPYTGSSTKFENNNETSTWNTAQFHFHAPSEHTFEGIHYDLEMHTVHTKEGDTSQYLVVGIVYELDVNATDDPFITSLNLTAVAGTTVNVASAPMADLAAWINKEQKYNYQGSLTTPICTEAVEWFVVKERKKINASQLSLFSSLWGKNAAFPGDGNNR
jgi:carbonic anhydrase